MVQSLTLKIYSYPAGQEIPFIYGTQSFITYSTALYHELVQSSSHFHIQYL